MERKINRIKTIEILAEGPEKGRWGDIYLGLARKDMGNRRY